MLGRTVDKRGQRIASRLVERRDNILARNKFEINKQGQFIDFLQRLLGIYRDTTFVEIQKMAQAVVEDLMQDLKDIDFRTEEGRFQAIATQAEIRSMEWFANGRPRVEQELTERKLKRDRLMQEIEDMESKRSRKSG